MFARGTSARKRTRSRTCRLREGGGWICRPRRRGKLKEGGEYLGVRERADKESMRLTVWVEDGSLELHFGRHVRELFWEDKAGAEETTCGYEGEVSVRGA